MRFGPVIGNLGKDPIEISSGKGLAFSIAESKGKKQSDGTWINESHWFNMYAYGNTKLMVKNLGLKKGDRVLIEGEALTYKDKEGKTQISFYVNQIYRVLRPQEAAQENQKQFEGMSEEDKAWNMLTGPTFDSAEEIPF